MAENGTEGKPADPLTQTMAQWTEFWRSMAGQFGQPGAVWSSEAWSKSMLPFIMARATENRSGAGNELGDAIERLAQGPRLADVVDFDRKLLGVFTAWRELQSKLAAYNVIAARPWVRAAEQYNAATGANKENAAGDGWRDRLNAWHVLANDELIRNQRADDFLAAQKDLLQAATEFRARQTEINETVAKVFGLPTQSDFDDVTRQLTELRREVRALARRLDQGATAAKAEGGAP